MFLKHNLLMAQGLHSRSMRGPFGPSQENAVSMKNKLSGLTAIGLFSLACSAYADPAVPDATFQLNAGGQQVATSGSLTGTSCGGPGGGGCENSTASATTSLVLKTNGTGSAQWSSNPDALAVVYYEVVGGGNIAVPVVIAGSGSTSLTGPGYSFAQIDGDIGAPAQDCTEINDPLMCSSNTNAGPLTQDVSVNSNTVYNFVMQTGCEVNSGTCSSFLDPTVSIDPTFLAANPGYSVVLSPNITSGAPVPEPATLSLLGLGLAGVGFSRKR